MNLEYRYWYDNNPGIGVIMKLNPDIGMIKKS